MHFRNNSRDPDIAKALNTSIALPINTRNPFAVSSYNRLVRMEAFLAKFQKHPYDARYLSVGWTHFATALSFYTKGRYSEAFKHLRRGERALGLPRSDKEKKDGQNVSFDRA